MTRPDSFRFGFYAALGAAILALLLYLGWWLLQAVMSIISPFVGAMVVALLLDPLVSLVQSRVTRGHRFRAVLIVFLVFLVVFTGLFTFVVPNLVAQTQRLVRWFSPVTYTVKRAAEGEDRFVTVAEGLTTTRHQVRGLMNGQTYRFVVDAVDADGVGNSSVEVLVTPHDDASSSSVGSTRNNPEPRAVEPVRPTEGPPPTGSPAIAPVPPGDATGMEGTVASEGEENEDKTASSAPRQLIAVSGDGSARLSWLAPAAGRSGFDELRTKVDAWLTSHRQLGPVKLPRNLDSITTQYSDQLAQALKVTAGRAASIVIGGVSSLLSVVLVPIIAVYILADIDRLRARLLFLLPDRVRVQALTYAQDVGGVFGNYVRGLFTVCALYAGAAMVALLGVSVAFPALRGYALLLGFASGLLYAVPYVGALTTVLLSAIVCVATGSGTTALLVSVGVLLALNQVFDNVIMPRVVGGGVGLHPILALFALLLGGTLFGLWGMLLSVPVAASIQVVLFRIFPKLAAPTPLSLLMPQRRPERRPAPEEDRDEVSPPEG